MLRSGRELYVRYSRGYEADREGGSLDTESSLELPGLPVNPSRPEPWWTARLWEALLGKPNGSTGRGFPAGNGPDG